MKQNIFKISKNVISWMKIQLTFQRCLFDIPLRSDGARSLITAVTKARQPSQ
jgi:hypothetical protein